mmetsp:Transcript_76123/g.198340  ORF Transcript_76123/g.198340 Transcript_76123/m.198340 type:complete len:518 (+) Transcript_76123:3-1556(+)
MRAPASSSSREVGGFVDFAAATCAMGLQNCNVSTCCSTPGHQCYEQAPGFYSQCRPSCVPGKDPMHWDGGDWTCKETGARTAGEDPCGDPGMDCRQSKCCRQPGHTCFEKNVSWATCKAECMPGAPDLNDIDPYPWSCNKFGETKTGAMPWIAGQCADGGWADCTKVGCCKNAGEICYKQNDYFGTCKPACQDNGWSCETVGQRTPSKYAPKGGKMPAWAPSTCSGLNQGCLHNKCCIGMDVQCIEKDATWAQCMDYCQPGAHADDSNATWSCKPVGPKSYGVTTKGFPSLYCFAVIRTTGYEPGLLKAQYDIGAGIFGCDDFSILTADDTTMVGDYKTVQFPGAPIVRSIDNTAGNTLLFVNAWQAIVGLNIWRNHTYTLKIDPDAVMLPDRIRNHLYPHVGENMYVVNCPIGDMMYGAVEAFSYYAIKAWWLRGHECNDPNNWGEDKYMTNCMDHLGVARVHDTAIVGDNLCLGTDNCMNGNAAAFHPFKDVGSWIACYRRAVGEPQQTLVPLMK